MRRLTAFPALPLFALFAALLLLGTWLVGGDGGASDPAAPIGPHWLVERAVEITALGGWGVLIPLTFLAVGLLAVRGDGRAALLLLAATFSGRVAVSLLKEAIARPRPPIAGHLVEVTSFSFPSGHAANAALVYCLLAATLARAGRWRGAALAAAILLTLLIGASRVYLGVHWPSDVAAGWLFGALWAMLWLALADWRSQR